MGFSPNREKRTSLKAARIPRKRLAVMSPPVLTYACNSVSAFEMRRSIERRSVALDVDEQSFDCP